VVDVMVTDAEVIKVLTDEVIKRDTLEGPPAEAAARGVARVEAKTLRGKGTADGGKSEADAAEQASN
jgi:hypothetical protein